MNQISAVLLRMLFEVSFTKVLDDDPGQYSDRSRFQSFLQESGFRPEHFYHKS